MPEGCPERGIWRHPFPLVPSGTASFQHQRGSPRVGKAPTWGVWFFRDSQLEPGGDADQSAGVLLHVVELGDLRSRVPQQVGHLPGGEGPETAVRLFHPVDQVGGEGVAQGVEASALQASRCQDAVIPLPEVHWPGVAAVLVGDEGDVYKRQTCLGVWNNTVKIVLIPHNAFGSHDSECQRFIALRWTRV